MALIDERRDALSSVRRLADEGVLTIPALHHPYAVEFRPILTLSDDEADTIIESVRTALA
jgi:4-aminobutyrate aminotransferase-like enzyme